MKKFLFFFLTVVVVVFSCKKVEESNDIALPNHLQGTWVYTNIENTIQVMHKSDSLLTNRYGFTVLPNGKFIERKNSGLCGSGGEYIYKDYEGEWRHPELFLYHVKVEHLEGILEYDMIIDYLHKDSLRFQYVFSSITP